MGLRKEKEFPNGVRCSYWKIATIEISLVNNSARVHLHLYMDKASRDAGREPYATPFYDFYGDSFCFTASDMDVKNPLKIAYDLLKESEFSDAEDL